MGEDVKISLPDLEKMFQLIKEIHDLSLEKALLDIKIKDMEASIVQIVTTDPAFFVAGKTPSQEYIKNSFLHRGLTGELIPLREQLAGLVTAVEEKKLELSLLQDVIAIWRTQSANERNTY